MDPGMKQRLVGAAVLVAIAVIFLPMLVQGPAPDSGVSDVPLSMPDTPRGEYETRDLPLVTPGDAPAGGAVGMQSGMPASPTGEVLPAADDDATPMASQPEPADGADAAVATETLPAPSGTSGETFPAAIAGGDYAVSFGAYATMAAADAIVGALRASQLPGYREAATINGKPAQRVRIGPYATRADAEAARLRAAQVRDDVGARVVVLDSPVSPPLASAVPPKAAPAADAVAPATTTPVVPAKAAPMPSVPPPPAKVPAATAIGFAVQLAAFSKPEDATALRDKVRAAGFSAFTESVATDKGTLTRVRVGPVANRADAVELQSQVKAKLGLDGVVRPHP